MPDNTPKTGKRGGKRSTSFKPGQCGNPGGRPKKTPELRRIEDMAKEFSEQAMAALLDEAQNGKGAPRVAAAIAVLDRGWGKSIDRQETGGPGGFDGVTTEELEAKIKADRAAMDAIERAQVSSTKLLSKKTAKVVKARVKELAAPAVPERGEREP